MATTALNGIKEPNHQINPNLGTGTSKNLNVAEEAIAGTGTATGTPLNGRASTGCGFLSLLSELVAFVLRILGFAQPEAAVYPAAVSVPPNNNIPATPAASSQALETRIGLAEAHLKASGLVINDFNQNLADAKTAASNNNIIPLLSLLISINTNKAGIKEIENTADDSLKPFYLQTIMDAVDMETKARDALTAYFKNATLPTNAKKEEVEQQLNGLLVELGIIVTDSITTRKKINLIKEDIEVKTVEMSQKQKELKISLTENDSDHVKIKQDFEDRIKEIEIDILMNALGKPDSEETKETAESLRAEIAQQSKSAKESLVELWADKTVKECYSKGKIFKGSFDQDKLNRIYNALDGTSLCLEKRKALAPLLAQIWVHNIDKHELTAAQGMAINVTLSDVKKGKIIEQLEKKRQSETDEGAIILINAKIKALESLTNLDAEKAAFANLEKKVLAFDLESADITVTALTDKVKTLDVESKIINSNELEKCRSDFTRNKAALANAKTDLVKSLEETGKAIETLGRNEADCKTAADLLDAGIDPNAIEQFAKERAAHRLVGKIGDPTPLKDFHTVKAEIYEELEKQDYLPGNPSNNETQKIIDQAVAEVMNSWPSDLKS